MWRSFNLKRGKAPGSLSYECRQTKQKSLKNEKSFRFDKK